MRKAFQDRGTHPIKFWLKRAPYLSETSVLEKSND